MYRDLSDTVERRFQEVQEEIRQLKEGRPRGGLSWEERRGIGGFVPADKDHDNDFDPLTSTSWDGDSFSTSTGTINWHKDFGVPLGVKAVKLYIAIRDSSATINAANILMSARSTSTNSPVQAWTEEVSDEYNRKQWDCPVAADGTSYYSITASGAGTCDIVIRVIGWYI